MFELVLVSQSPRRRNLLLNKGFIFRSDIVKVSEFIEENLKIELAIEAVAESKAQAWVDANKSLKSKEILVLTADTVVVYNGRVLGKPNSPEQAEEFLGLLSGKTHSVITGLCLWNLKTDQKILTHETTKVLFRALTKSEISEYVAGGEPMDKAGAYGIQGDGGQFVESTEGSFTNVVGLPMELLEKLLQEQGWNVSRN